MDRVIATPVPLAGWSRRMLAGLIDLAPLADVVAWWDSVPWIAVLVLAYLWLMGHLDGVVGQSPGRARLGLRVVDGTGAPIGGRAGVARRLGPGHARRPHRPGPARGRRGVLRLGPLARRVRARLPLAHGTPRRCGRTTAGEGAAGSPGGRRHRRPDRGAGRRGSQVPPSGRPHPGGSRVPDAPDPREAPDLRRPHHVHLRGVGCEAAETVAGALDPAPVRLTPGRCPLRA